MPEEITFHFEGSLADAHSLNFYEAARFQYAAARLLVKLIQFRTTGSFVSKITNNTNKDIQLRSHKDGSFDISVIAPLIAISQEHFINVTISQLMSFVFERLVGKTSNTDVAEVLNSHKEVVDRIGHIDDNHTDTINRALSIIEKDQDIKEKLHANGVELLERRISELEREQEVQSAFSQLRLIDFARGQKLIAMSAPLLAEMATALRRSADTLEITGKTNDRAEIRILYLNNKMAAELELAVVDDQITPLLANIIQYNKETGWGKVRADALQSKPIAFSIPSDMKSHLQNALLHGMNRDAVYLQVYVVRNRAKEPSRLIVVGLLENPPSG
jgi:hypothetical protein